MPGALELDEGEASPLLSLAALSLLEEDVSPVLLLALEVVVVEEVVCTAAASALVFVGGVMSGVLFGMVSETLALPHAASTNPHSNAASAASAARPIITGGPSAFRRWGSR